MRKFKKECFYVDKTDFNDLDDQYFVTSNRESGFGRYDVLLEPKREKAPEFIMECKVRDTEGQDLADTVRAAPRQIEDWKYDAVLKAKEIAKERIRKYGIAFQGKRVQIGKETETHERKNNKGNHKGLF